MEVKVMEMTILQLVQVIPMVMVVLTVSDNNNDGGGSNDNGR